MNIEQKQNERVLPPTNTRWTAEELNQVVSELLNVITEYAITPDAGNVTQLLEALNKKFYNDAFKVRGLLTGVTPNVMTQTTITINDSGQLVIGTAIPIIYNDPSGARGIANYSAQVIEPQTINAPSQPSGVNAVVYIYAVRDTVNNVTPTINVTTSKQTSADYCLLGSAFILKDGGWKFQAGSFAATPYLVQSSQRERECADILTAGGLILGNANQTMQMKDVTLDFEGIGVGTNKENFKTIPATNPTPYKFIYLTYGNTELTHTSLLTARIFNTATQSLANIAGGYNIMIPCITPTGQFLLRPMEKNGTATAYATMEAAIADVINLQYSEGNYDDRLIYLGFSIVVAVGATDFTNPANFRIVAVLPNQLTAFGGLAGTGVPGTVPDFSNLSKGIIKGKAQDGYLTESGDGDATGKIQGWKNKVPTATGTVSGVTYQRFGTLVLCANENDANVVANANPSWIVGF